MANEKTENTGLKVLQFAGVSIPQPIENLPKDDNKFVTWGMDNLYPYFLIDVYQNSYTHSAIINNKADYVIGAGLKLVNGSELTIKLNAADTIGEFTRKIVIDYLLFNCFAVEVVYNAFNQPIQYFHVPMHKLRMNKSKTKFWFAEDWKKSKPDYMLHRWTKENEEGKSKIFFFDGYFPTYSHVYPEPSYKSAIKSMLIESKLQTYSLNLVENHFSPSTIVTFHQGNNISEEQKLQTIRTLKDSYTGASGKKVIVDFQTTDGKPANVQSIDQVNADTFTKTKEEAQNAIFVAHEITTPELFGVPTPGKLGTGDVEVQFEIWKNKYVVNKRNEVASALNTLFSNFEEIAGEVEFTDRPLFVTQVSAETKEKVMTKNEIRKELGLPAIPGWDIPVAETIQNEPVQPVQPKQFSSELIELTEADYEKIADMGTVRDEYEFHGDGEFVFSMQDMNKHLLKFETAQEIAEYIISKKIKDITLPELKTLIRKDLGIDISTDDLQNHIDNINKSGVVSIDTDEEGHIKVTPSEGEKPKRVEVMYAYELREGVNGAPIIETTRPFCRRLINNNRVYTRAEIQRMGQLFGYDVFNLGGGFYRNPDTGEATPFCRHRFRAYTVSRRARG